MALIRWTLCLLATASFSLSSFSQSISASKLSAHLINAYTAASSNIISGHPRLLKVLALDSGFPAAMAQAMRDYKTLVPAGKIVVRVYSPKTYSLSDDPTASAGDFWTNILDKSLSSLSVADRALIDYLEGPNEGETPTLGYPSGAPMEASEWFNQFWTNLTPRISAAGYRPCIGSIAVGNPGGSTAEMQSYLAAFVPALRQAQAAGGAWSYHAYTINYTTDASQEFYYSLRYRQFYSYFATAFPDLVSLPIILTEGGVDLSGDPAASGWQARGSQADYERWLNWFDSELQQDSYVLGCTLFENGDPAGWPSFDLEPISGWLEDYLLGPADYSAPPTPIAVVGSDGITISWTNAPVAPTVWNVKRSTNSSGPFFIVGEHVNSGVTASAFTDSAVTSGVTYYYVVTAVNSLGEGPASAVVSAQLVPATSVAVNCGGGAAGSFQADNFFDSGTAFATSSSIDTAGLAQPAPMAVYQSQRYGDLTYTLRGLFPNSSYELRLHFAEVYWTSPGQRVFNVLINGGTALANFDITADSGGSLRGDIKEFYAVSDPLGRIKLQLVTVLDNAAINGIEAHEMTPVSVPAAPANLTATTGNAVVNLSWLAPSGATGFYVKRASSSGGPYVTIATNVSASSYADVGFTPNTACYYVVTATNAFGESPPTPEVGVQAPSGLPDVVVTSVSWTPANLFSGTHAIFTARVLNRGSAPTPAGTVLGVGFNMDGAGTVSWSGSYSAALAPGASVDLSADNGPSGVNYWVATRGPHTLVATVDDINRFPESDESNNSLSVGVPVLASPFSISKLSVTNGWAVVEWESSPGSTYQVQTTDTLLHPSWKAVGTNVTATATLSRATNAVDSATARFYRIARFD